MRWRIVLLGLALAIACRREEPLNVLLITIDTARADAFGAYGATGGATPAFDSIARDGVLFEQASAPVPLTLPSHTSLLTGMYPPHHGIRENGSAVVPENAVTLAEVLRSRGYRTGAFVGAYVLDARWGLDQGFDQYSGSFDSNSAEVFSLSDLQRTADSVADDALKWLAGDSDKPFFAWVHFFDPHEPYQPPAGFASRYPDDPYAGEIAFTDTQIARLLQHLDRTGAADNTAVIVVADHGEGFGEHGENGHGLLLYEESLHVPLVIRAPTLPRGKRIAIPVSLVDLFPTITTLTSVQPPPNLHGHSLNALIEGQAHATPIYAETLYPRRRFGWSELRVLRRGSEKLIDSSEPELYDLTSDPGETSDLTTAGMDRLRAPIRELRKLVSDMEKDAIKAPVTTADAETRARLAALGYLSGPSRHTAANESLPSPRSKMPAFGKLVDARTGLESGDFPGTEAKLNQLVRDEPGMLEAHIARGELYLRWKRYEESAAAFRTAHTLAPDDPTLLSALATAELQSGRPEAAQALLNSAIAQTPDEPRYRFLLGRTWLALADIVRAKQEFEHAVRSNPRSAAALVELAGIAIAEKKPDAARAFAERALAVDARARGARLFRAQAFEQLGRPDDAWSEARKEVETWPDDFRPAYYLAELAPKVGRATAVESHLRRAIELEPRFAVSYLRLAQHFLQRGEKFDEAIRLTKKALELKLQGRDEALAYFLLADLYNRTGNETLSRQNAARGRAIGK